MREDLVALAQQLGGAVSVGAGCAGGGEVVFGAFDGGAGLAAVGVGGAEVLGVGQVVGEDGEQGVGGLLLSAVVMSMSLVLVAAAVWVSQRSWSGVRAWASSTMSRLPSGSVWRLAVRSSR